MHRNLDQLYTNTNILLDELVNNIVKYTMLLICVEGLKRISSLMRLTLSQNLASTIGSPNSNFWESNTLNESRFSVDVFPKFLFFKIASPSLFPFYCYG